jgi:hypothetical protein
MPNQIKHQRKVSSRSELPPLTGLQYKLQTVMDHVLIKCMQARSCKASVLIIMLLLLEEFLCLLGCVRKVPKRSFPGFKIQRWLMVTRLCQHSLVSVQNYTLHTLTMEERESILQNICTLHIPKEEGNFHTFPQFLDQYTPTKYTNVLTAVHFI